MQPRARDLAHRPPAQAVRPLRDLRETAADRLDQSETEPVQSDRHKADPRDPQASRRVSTMLEGLERQEGMTRCRMW